MARPSKEYQAFRNLTDKLLTVSKETVDKRIAAYKERLPESEGGWERWSAMFRRA